MLKEAGYEIFIKLKSNYQYIILVFLFSLLKSEDGIGKNTIRTIMRYLYIILGLITLSLGLLGIITPGLPTTPFILLTGFLLAKGSPRLHQKLLDNKLTGRYIRKVNNGFSVRGLLLSIGIMWCMVCFTAFFVFNYGTMRFVMLGLGVIGTISQVIVLRRKRRTVKISLNAQRKIPDNGNIQAS